MWGWGREAKTCPPVLLRDRGGRGCDGGVDGWVLARREEEEEEGWIRINGS